MTDQRRPGNFVRRNQENPGGTSGHEQSPPSRETDPKSSAGLAFVLFSALAAAAGVIWYLGN